MASAIFYNAAKKENSTLRPSGGTTIDVKLKDGTDLISPVFILNYGSTPTWTEVFFEGRYYFINSIESVRNDLWAISCRVDALATYKDVIGAQTLYVVRSSNRFDGAIIDTTYPAKTGIIVQETEANSPYDALNFTGGTYIIGIVCADTGGVGAVTYYAFTRATFNTFMAEIMNVGRYGVNTTEVSENLQKMLFNPFQYIASCIWFPFNIDKFAGTNGTIKYGWWSLTASGKKLSSASPITINRTIQTAAHPQQQSRGAYLSAPPYTRKYIRFMPFGIFEVDPQIYFGAESIGLWLSVDVITGAGILEVYHIESNDDWIDHQILQSQIGIQIQLSQMNLDFNAQMNVINSGVGFFAQLAQGNIAGALTSGINAIGDAVQSKVPTLQSNGMNGGCASLQGTLSCLNEFQLIVDEDNAHRGRPYCQLAQIGSVGGFMVVSDADFDIACTDTERTIIKQFMESGFYYE